MGTPLLVEFFSALPEDAVQEAPDLPASRSADRDGQARKPAAGGKARRRAAVHVFCKQVQERYTEGTLLRLLQIGDASSRRACIFALGLLGTMAVNEALTVCLHDEDEEAARLASDALWTLWFRGDSSPHSDELHRLVRSRDPEKVLAGLNDLIARAPHFAEVHNQRAIVHFRLEKYDRSATDCEAALKLNPHHFGAQAGLGQCYLRLRKHRAALRAFKVALRINPRLEGVAEAVRTLENTLGEAE
jgi:tetratricopeptide (TPR) repeat protein